MSTLTSLKVKGYSEQGLDFRAVSDVNIYKVL